MIGKKNDDHKSSGHTIATYCASNSIPVGSFYKHKQRLRETEPKISITTVVIESEAIQLKIDGRCFEFGEPN